MNSPWEEGKGVIKALTHRAVLNREKKVPFRPKSPTLTLDVTRNLTHTQP